MYTIPANVNLAVVLKRTGSVYSCILDMRFNGEVNTFVATGYSHRVCVKRIGTSSRASSCNLCQCRRLGLLGTALMPEVPRQNIR